MNTCKYCGKEIPETKKYCGRECYTASMRVKETPHIQTTEGRKEVSLDYQEKPIFAVTEEIGTTEKGQLGMRLQVEEVCNCGEFEGSSYNCSIHAPVMWCPKCHCVGTEILSNNQEHLSKEIPTREYRCAICGVFYMRNWDTGKYLLDGEELVAP